MSMKTTTKTIDCIVRRAGTVDADALDRLVREPALAMNGRAMPGACAGAGRDQRNALRELMDADLVTLVADARDGLRGFAQLRRGMRPPAEGWMRGSLELRRHAVRARHRGAGVGIRLLEAALECARAQEATGVWLKVAKDATQAIAFYQRHGFRFAGTSLFIERQLRREHWVMHRRLRPEPVAALARPVTSPCAS